MWMNNVYLIGWLCGLNMPWDSWHILRARKCWVLLSPSPPSSLHTQQKRTPKKYLGSSYCHLPPLLAFSCPATSDILRRDPEVKNFLLSAVFFFSHLFTLASLCWFRERELKFTNKQTHSRYFIELKAWKCSHKIWVVYASGTLRGEVCWVRNQKIHIWEGKKTNQCLCICVCVKWWEWDSSLKS